MTRFGIAVRRGVKQLRRMVFSQPGGLFFRLLPRTRINFRAELGDRMSSSVIMAPLLWMARNFPEAPVRVLDADGAPVDGHPMTRFLRRPNQFYSGIILWMATLLSWVVDGNAYWLKIKNGAGGVVELWYVPHWMIEPEGDEDTFVAHYAYTPGVQRFELPPEDIVHFRYGLDPDNPRKGRSPLHSVLREVFTDDEAANFSAALLRNAGVPGLLVSPRDNDYVLSPDEAESTKAYLREQMTGDRRGEPLVNRGPTRVDQFGFSPEQMVLRDLRKIPEERVSGVLGVAAIVAGLGAGLDRSTFANFSEAREAAWEENIIPTQRLFAEELRHQLLGDFDDRAEEHDVDFDLSSVRVLQADRNEEATRLRTLYEGGIVTRGEAREELNLDASDADNVYRQPINVTLVPAGDAQPALQAVAARKRVKAEVGGERLILALNRTGRLLTDVTQADMRMLLDGLGETVARAYRTSGVRYRRNGHAKQEPEEQPTEAEVSAIVAAAALIAWQEAQAVPTYERTHRRVAEAVADVIRDMTGLDVDVPDRVVADFVRSGGRRAGLLDVEGDTRRALFRALADARERGLGVNATADVIREHVPRGRFRDVTTRARMIADTEVAHGMRAASLTVYGATEGVVGVRAYDAQLGPTDATCEARDGVIYTLEEASLQMADEHPRGTLAFSPVTGDLSSAVPA